MKITRYATEHIVTSSLNHFDDMRDWLGYLTSSEYVVSLLREKHGYTAADARNRAARIIPHARCAVAYLNQVDGSPNEVSFLPAYYAILNMAKLYVLVGKYAREFTHNSRWHGATYSVHAKDSQSILTEQITLQPGGSLALFYKTLTDTPIQKRKKLRVGDLYHCISDIYAEYRLATKEPPICLAVDFRARVEDQKLTVEAELVPGRIPPGFSIRHAPALNGFRKKSGTDATYQKYVGRVTAENQQEKMRSAVQTRYLYHSNGANSMLCYRRSRLKFTEEFPIALVFFHLSSVCRYKPEFLDRMRGSKFWPVLMAARRHALYKFMVLTWSFLHQTDYRIISQ